MKHLSNWHSGCQRLRPANAFPWSLGQLSAKSVLWSKNPRNHCGSQSEDNGPERCLSGARRTCHLRIKAPTQSNTSEETTKLTKQSAATVLESLQASRCRYRHFESTSWPWNNLSPQVHIAQPSGLPLARRSAQCQKRSMRCSASVKETTPTYTTAWHT